MKYQVNFCAKTWYRKSSTISPVVYTFQRPFLRGLSTEGNLRLQIDWASLMVRSKFTVFTLFYFVFEGNFPSTSSPGGLYLEGRFNGGFFALRIWGAYIWRGLFSEFYGIKQISDIVSRFTRLVTLHWRKHHGHRARSKACNQIYFEVWLFNNLSWTFSQIKSFASRV